MGGKALRMTCVILTGFYVVPELIELANSSLTGFRSQCGGGCFRVDGVFNEVK